VAPRNSAKKSRADGSHRKLDGTAEITGSSILAGKGKGMGAMKHAKIKRSLIAELSTSKENPVVIRGWVARLRRLSKNVFVVVRDCSGEIQCVFAPEAVEHLALKVEDTIHVEGTLANDPRAKGGLEIIGKTLTILNTASNSLPFNSASDGASISQEVILQHRPLSLRTKLYSEIFAVQGAILRLYREFLTRERFSEIVTSKIVGGGTEGGTNVFEIKYFERSAYLAQSPQFFKEHCVAGFERVFETGHVYRAEPHASSRHLTEYYSLDLEMGFIDGPEDIIELERRLLDYIFQELNSSHGEALMTHRKELLPSMKNVPLWGFSECLERLKATHNRSDLIDDLDPEAERQLCALAKEECGTGAVFVLGFPLSARPFYTAPRGNSGISNGFDLLFEGLEITTGGQRLHNRQDLEAALKGRRMDPANFEDHLRMFELGMPPHGGLAIGLERLTAQIMKRNNVRDASLYPRDRYRVSP
jgi:nondiscriminating aspartyl-tRNA synthetase